MVDYERRLTQEQRSKLEELREVLAGKELAVINEYQPNGLLRSYSIGMATFRLPDLVIYGLPEEEVRPFFDAYFSGIDDPERLRPYSEFKFALARPSVATRLFPLLSCLYPRGFQLAQALQPKLGRRGKPNAIWIPRIYLSVRIPDEVVPPGVLRAEAEEREVHDRGENGRPLVNLAGL